jgi:putative mRNA 3-end processing factor
LKSNLLKYTKKGLYCPHADIYIDPWGNVDKAVITHAHSDHARRGSENYLAHPVTSQLMKHRLGSKINVQDLEYGCKVTVNGIKLSLYPAGHVPGSAQVKLEGCGEVAVVSGDYKTENDGLSAPFEPVKCNVFVTESTFALPIYKWEPQEVIYKRINDWWRRNKAAGIVSVLYGYSIGKTQRIIKHLNSSIGKIYTHPVIEDVNEILRTCKINLPKTHRLNEKTSSKELNGNIVIAPPSFTGTGWLGGICKYSVGYASGWLKTRKAWGRQSIDIGFSLSDHADWDGLNKTVKETGAEVVYATHGFTSQFVKFLRAGNIDAFELKED